MEKETFSGLKIEFKAYTLRRCCEPGFGPRDENEATNGAEILTAWDLYITAEGDLQSSFNTEQNIRYKAFSDKRV